MVNLHFQDIQFSEENDRVRGIFLNIFSFELKHSELSKIGKWKIVKGDLEIEGTENIVRKNFNFLLEQKLKELKGLQAKPANYIYEGMMPLIGSLYFGIVDRNTNIIEVRPITGCNLNCIFCSVDLCKRERDFVVQADYLYKEAEKLAKLKREMLIGKASGTTRADALRGKVKQIEIHINAQGEPLLYSPLAELISKLKKIKGVKQISIDTNGTLLNEEKVDELVKAGLTRFNISLNAFSEEMSKKIAGTPYPLENVKKICRYIAKKADILLAPVWMQGINDKDIEDLINFSLELKKLRNQKVPMIGVQNFLEYEHGKMPTKSIGFEEFFEKLKILEKKYNLKLILSRDDFGIVPANVLKKPFDKDDFVKATVICDGKFRNEKLCSAYERIISVRTSKQIGKAVNCKITRSKYNVFYGREI